MRKPGWSSTINTRIVGCTGASAGAIGSNVITAADGFEAIEAYRNATRPDVVLLDIDMPGMNGTTCFEHLRELDPSVRVIFMSGQASNDPALGPGTCFLTKPMDFKELLRRIPQMARGPEATLELKALQLEPHSR